MPDPTALDFAKHGKLRRRCLLPLIYSHLTSLQQFGRLLRKQSESDAARVDS